MLARLLLVLIAVVGCSARGEPIADWVLEVDDMQAPSISATRVSLPSKLFAELPMRSAAYVLRTEVALAPDQRGQPLTLAVDCFHSTLSLAVDGAAIPNLGDTGVGEHRFAIPAAMTRGDRLALALHAKQDHLSLGFGGAPRLAIGTDTGHSPAARFNRYTAIIELGLLGAFGILYTALYLFGRRRQDATFVVVAACVTIGPIWQLGLLPDIFGAFAPAALGIALSGANLGLLYFLHISFKLGPPPRVLVAVTAAIAIAFLASPLSFKIAFALLCVFAAATVAIGLHILRILWQQAWGKQRHDGWLWLVALVTSLLLISPDILSFVFGFGDLGGAHLVSLGIVVFVVSQALFLARQTAIRALELERTSDELQRQVAKQALDLRDALAQLAQRPAAALDADRVIAERYRVVRKLGAGGMGAVYEVERLSDARRLALKTLRGRTDPDLQARFAQEAHIAAGIEHPNLVPVLDVGIADGALYLVMPLVEGGSLEHHRAKFGDAKWARPLLAQIADGLAALHARGIVHRDLKPGNVLVAGGEIRIADFGLAALRDTDVQTQVSEVGLADTAANSPLTRAGAIFGTPGYMAPELMSTGARDITAAADIYALGVIAYEMLTGAPLPPKPDGLDPIIARCLDPDPAKRPSASEVSASVLAKD